MEINLIQNTNWVIWRLYLILLVFLTFFISACSELEKPETDEFYADSIPPPSQEFRWSNGEMPKSFDPAFASAPPETDIVRAIYDGLTEINPKNLEAVPAIATKWSSSDDFKTWTFKLRDDARWSNGKKITAKDFVRSWKRLGELGKEASHSEILRNIVGIQPEKKRKETEEDVFARKKENDFLKDNPKKDLDFPSLKKKTDISKRTPFEMPPPPPLPTPSVSKEKMDKFGVVAINDLTLRVALIKPDKEFPKLVAHPIFRPVYADGKEFKDNKLNTKIITTGAFKVVSAGKKGVFLEKSENYYNKKDIKLQKVRFVPTKDPESALQAYRKGEVDAVTNAQFEPLALKLLEPYVDFQRTTHSALNFYEFNRKNQPFNDRRVREALAISIDRERLTKDEMKGATKPALRFLPFDSKKKKNDFSPDIQKAKNLLKKAGFENGENFPKIRLVINRNDTQQRIARSIARMWKQNLNVETEIIVREFKELEEVKKNWEFDIIRRGIVLPTADETANMLAIFGPRDREKFKIIANQVEPAEKGSGKSGKPEKDQTNTENKVLTTNGQEINEVENASDKNEPNELLVDIGEEELILTEEEAILEVPAIPLYFPTSFSLVKPYVKGFEMSNLDAPLLKNVLIDNNWQPNNKTGES